MVAVQRHAIFNLCVSLAAFATFGLLIPHFGVAQAQGGFALLVFAGLGPILFLRRCPFDERDRAIFLRATQITFITFWLLFVGGVMTVYIVLRQQSSLMPIDLLPLVVWIGWATLLVCHAVAILTLYWRSNRESAGSAE